MLASGGSTFGVDRDLRWGSLLHQAQEVFSTEAAAREEWAARWVC